MSSRPLLLAVPNVSAAADRAAVTAIGRASAPARTLDVHSDVDHGRTVFTLAARQGALARAVLAAARAALATIDLTRHTGLHPHVGVVDVAPIVYLDEAAHGAACADALTLGGLIGDELGVPVFLYGDLATDDRHRERAALRAGGPVRLRARIARRELEPDYGPASVDLRAGATLVTARPPLVAFNVELASADVQTARRIAAGLREAGGGLTGVRAIGLEVESRRRAQVSMNVHDHRAAPLASIVAAIAERAAIAEAEIVGLVPAAALDGFPADVPLRGFDPARHVIENALRSALEG